MEIDHTCLGKETRKDDLEELLEQANKYGINICVPPWSVEYFDDFSNKVITVVDFPQGQNSPEGTRDEAKKYIKHVDEIDYCSNITYLRDFPKLFRKEAQLMSDLDIVTKSIIECGVLSENEIRKASRICSQEGIDYIKTSSGFHGGGAEEEHIRIINEVIGEDTKIKASGGIYNYNKAAALVDAGASRIGSSKGHIIASNM